MRPNWQYNEFQQPGVDYADLAQAAQYDQRHQRFRDYQRQAQAIISALSLTADHTVIDVGTGTGAFSLYAAKYCRKLIAVDVSLAMLERCRQKANKAQLDNIEFCHAGFLTYQHNGAPVDAIVSMAVLHHLPDFWKLIALSRMAQMLKPGGRLCLADVVFDIDPVDYERQFDNLIEDVASKFDTELARDMEHHIQKEYSSADWMLESIIERAGFVIDAVHPGLLTTFLCTKA